jgi:hypothetical protein
MERESFMLEIRPLVAVDLNKNLDLEFFQSSTLRPILKFQNEILLSYFKHYLYSFHPKFKAFNKAIQVNLVRDLIKKNHEIKSKIAHLVVAMFTIDELNFYTENKKEIDKRLNELIIERINSQLEWFY